MSDEGASAPVSRGVLAAVIGLCLVAASALVNPYITLIGLTRQSAALTDFHLGTLDPLVPVAIVVAGMAALLSLLVFRYFPGTGWAWLVLAGTGICAIGTPVFDPAVRVVGGPVVALFAMGTTGPVVVVLGLLGAGNWLMRAAGVAAGGPVAAAPFAAPFLAAPFLYPLLFDPQATATATWAVAVVSVAAAVGLVALVSLRLRRVAAPAAQTVRCGIVGAIAGLLVVAPDLVARLGSDPEWYELADPRNPFLAHQDEVFLRFGLTGLLILIVALVLGAVLGVRQLAAALGTGLVIYGGTIAASVLASDPLARPGDTGISVPTGEVIACVVGILLGAVAVRIRWSFWLAGAACAVVGVLVAVVGFNQREITGDHALGRLPQPVGMALLGLAVFALTSTVIWAAAAVREGTQIPVVLGLLAVAFEVGLDNTDAMTQHSAIAGVAGPQPFALPGILAAVALLFGGLLIVALHRSAGTPAAEPAEPAEPVEPEPELVAD